MGGRGSGGGCRAMTEGVGDAGCFFFFHSVRMFFKD